MRTPENFEEGLLADLRHAKLVAVDGENGSGKWQLARDLIDQIGGSHIQVDDHLDTPSNGRKYIQQVKFSELKNVIEASKAPVFVDCFIALDVLDQIGIKPDLLLHCKKVYAEAYFVMSQNKDLPPQYDEYKSRRNPEALARHVFTWVR